MYYNDGTKVEKVERGTEVYYCKVLILYAKCYHIT